MYGSVSSGDSIQSEANHTSHEEDKETISKIEKSYYNVMFAEGVLVLVNFTFGSS